MPNFNSTTQIGHVTTDPELKSTPSGRSVIRLSIAVKDKFSKDKTNFFQWIIWGSQAEFVSKYCFKGDTLLLSGYADVEKYTTKNGNNVERVVFTALQVEKIASKRNTDPQGSQVVQGYEEVTDEQNLPF